MTIIHDSVGLGGKNIPSDVGKIQRLLNHNRHNVPESREISQDNVVGPQTIDAIRRFQALVVKLRRPDGRVDPGGKTLAAMNTGGRTANTPGTAVPAVPTVIAGVARILFPLHRTPVWSYKSGARYFGARRAGGRRHAGCDLIAPKGTPIRAVADGRVIKYYPFYSGTYAVEVRHGDGFIVRYGEASRLAPNVRVGGKVSRGQVIAYVGKLHSGSSMLHFEMYAGTGQGRLTVRGNRPFQRRADLINPTRYLDSAEMQ